MKKIITFITLLCSIAAFAQNTTVGKGDILVGGSFSFSQTTEQGSPSLSTLDFRGGALYFLNKNIALGPQIGYANQSQSGTSISQFSAGAAARPYIGNFFAEIGAAYNVNKISFFFGSSETNYASFGAAIGYDFFINDNVAVEPLFRYTRLQSKDVKANVIMFGIGFQIFLRPAASGERPAMQPRG